jgi:2-amino-4-hydroxy-6-hydroxymethyldihydropteridine diphosphokinase
MTLAYIAIGSNLASPLEQVNAAVQALGEIPQSRIVAVSSFYRTPPLGPQDQPDYLNAAVVLETELMPKRCWTIPSASNCSRAAYAKPNAGGRARWTSTLCCLVTRLTLNVSPFRITT